jgi:clan AA aspartic protease
MGITLAEITIKNAADMSEVDRGGRAERDVRQITVQAVVDTGAGSLVISDEICQRLGLKIEGLRGATVAGGARIVCRRTEPVRIFWKDRDTVCTALVMPGEQNVLLGAIPLEDMDLIVNPVKQELVGAHGDEIVCIVK